MLVAIHPGYALNTRRHIRSCYGDYPAYLSTLVQAIMLEYSIILKDKQTKCLPFCVPDAVQIVEDPNTCVPALDIATLADILKQKGICEVDVCGEFLWYYGPDVDKNLKEFKLTLEPTKHRRYETAIIKAHFPGPAFDIQKFCRIIGLDVDDFTQRIFYTEDLIEAGCVEKFANCLASDFKVNIRRELCYPRVEASR